MMHTKRPAAEQAERVQAAVQSRTFGRFARRAWTAVLALAASMGFVFLNAGSAAALNPGDVIGTNTLRNWETGRCLFGWTGQPWTQACDFGNNDDIWQVIYLFHFGNDVVQIKNKGTGRCLTAGQPPLMLGCDSNNRAQQWRGVGISWDKVRLANLADGKCLDSNRQGSVYVITCDAHENGYQMWKLGY